MARVTRYDRARRRYVLLSHHEDPVTRFEPALIVHRQGDN
jgi:hypothetical protein